MPNKRPSSTTPDRRGEADELHQGVKRGERMTTATGTPLGDGQNSLMPESTHMLLWAMSDRAIPRSFRFLEGFAVHIYRFVNAGGEATFVKFHWKPRQGMQSVVWNEALKIDGADPDFHRRDVRA